MIAKSKTILLAGMLMSGFSPLLGMKIAGNRTNQRYLAALRTIQLNRLQEERDAAFGSAMALGNVFGFSFLLSGNQDVNELLRDYRLRGILVFGAAHQLYTAVKKQVQISRL